MSSVVIPKKWIVLGVSFLVIFLAILFFGKPPQPQQTILPTESQADGVVTVKGGYFPKELVLPANKEVTLRFVTNNTYDCSASLLISELQIEKFLPPTGSTDLRIPPQKQGKTIIAGCSMGMYNFTLRFQ
ncbi:MAG: cupredoxin domain-containing protein [Patescibacteria group bacterium]